MKCPTQLKYPAQIVNFKQQNLKHDLYGSESPGRYIGGWIRIEICRSPTTIVDFYLILAK